MERYTLQHFYIYADNPVESFRTDLSQHITGDMTMGMMSNENISEVITFLANAIWGYFYNDLVAYPIDEPEDFSIFLTRIGYDISVKLPYWYRKYFEIKKLLTDDDFNLMQTSKVISSSQDTTDSASGSLQKTATTPTGVSVDSATDSFDITIDADSQTANNSVETTGFADKYTNAQQKYANSSKILGQRSGTITREGSVDDLIKVLEKLPSSFADEVTKELGKHFIFDYDHEGEYEQL